MPKIKILPHAELCPDGAEIDATVGKSVCENLLDNSIDIEHACELSCACTTCHVIFRNGFDSLNESTDDEEDLLDKAWGLEPKSRLSCQTIVDKEDLTIEIPKYTINMVSENHPKKEDFELWGLGGPGGQTSGSGVVIVTGFGPGGNL